MRELFSQYVHCMSTAELFDDHYSISKEERGYIITAALGLTYEDVIVELGVCNGATAGSLMRSCIYTDASYVGVDFFGLENSKENLDQILYDHGLEDYGVIIDQHTSATANAWHHAIVDRDNNFYGHLDINNKRYTYPNNRYPSKRQENNSSRGVFSDLIDLLIIDAGHDEANIKRDCELWLPLLRPRGRVFFHDHDGNPSLPSCHWAVTHYADLHTRDWPRTRLTPGMIVCTKPKP